MFHTVSKMKLPGAKSSERPRKLQKIRAGGGGGREKCLTMEKIPFYSEVFVKEFAATSKEPKTASPFA